MIEKVGGPGAARELGESLSVEERRDPISSPVQWLWFCPAREKAVNRPGK
jgi:hypothetical protein